MTFNQIISRIYTMYPHGESQATIVSHINSGLDELSLYFGKVIVDESITTTADDDDYAFPAGLSDISEIMFLDIGNQATPSDRYDYTRYSYCNMESEKPNALNYFQIYSSTGAKSLGLFPIPATTGLPVRITYRRKLTEATTTTLSSEPEFDSRYHDLLVYYTCYLICSSGASPDALQSDSFYKKWEDGLAELWRHKMQTSIDAPIKRKDNLTWHR